MFIFTFTFMFTFTSMSISMHMFAHSPTERERTIFQKFYVFSSALEGCLCNGIAFGMHPWKHIV